MFLSAVWASVCGVFGSQRNNISEGFGQGEVDLEIASKVVREQPRVLGGPKQKNEQANGKNRRVVSDFVNLAIAPSVEGKPQNQITRPITRSFGAQLLGNARAADVKYNSKLDKHARLLRYLLDSATESFVEQSTKGMAKQRVTLLTVTVLLLVLIDGSDSSQYIVGDLIWSIPPTNGFYTNWSSSQSFHIGDTLHFDFDSGLYDVIEVSRGEYDGCSTDQPFKAFMEGPAVINLNEKGVFYFICNVSNYCKLGQKVSVIVEEKVTDISPNLSPSPSPSPDRYVTQFKSLT